jgi:hypothetical protein
MRIVSVTYECVTAGLPRHPRVVGGHGGPGGRQHVHDAVGAEHGGAVSRPRLLAARQCARQVHSLAARRVPICVSYTLIQMTTICKL